MSIVYVIRADVSRVVKVGFARYCAKQRLKTIQGMSPEALSLVFYAEGNLDQTEEFAAHDALKEFRQHGEWFLCKEAAAIDAVKSVCEGAKFVDLRANPIKHLVKSGSWNEVQRKVYVEPDLPVIKPSELALKTVEDLSAMAIKIDHAASILGATIDDIKALVRAGELLAVSPSGSNNPRTWLFTKKHLLEYLKGLCP